MQARIYTFLYFTLLLVFPALAQQSYTLRGRVVDVVSGEYLAGATLLLKEKPAAGTVSGPDGNFILQAPAGNYTLVAKYIGYNPLELPVQLFRNQQLTVRMMASAYGVQEVEIIGTKQPPVTETPAMGQIDLPIETVKVLPALLGETDILKTVQLLPGVKSGGEGNTGFYVRGGGADQNLVQMDEAVVYNSGHLLNFLSVFNSDAIGNSTLIKGNIPAQYGGRLSSVLDVTMKDGDMSKYKVDGGIGIISSRLSVQGPIAKEKASFIVSARRTYVDALLNPFLKNTEQGGIPYYFYDLNGKISYTVTPKDRLYLSGYYGRDVGRLKLSSGRFTSKFYWGNGTGTLRWNHLFNDKHFVNLSAITSNYNFNFDWDFGGFRTVLITGVQDYSLKADFDLIPNVRHQLKYGFQYTHHKLRPRTGSAENTEGITFGTNRVRQKYAHEAAAYFSDDWALTDKLLLSMGLRGSYFRQVGPFSLYTYNEKEQVSDSVSYSKGQRVKEFQSLEPRLAVRYKITDNASVKAGYTQSVQYLHLVSNAYTTLPLDIWVPSSALVEPQRATQYALGYFRNFRKNEYESSVEVYYKTMQNQLEYREGYAPGPTNRDLEYEFVSGTGESYGIELFLRKNYGPLQGWLGYTLSYTNRQFPELNQGKEFPARFDRRHDGSLVVTYKYNDRWTFGSSFVYGTGQATTMPVRRYYIEGNLNYQYGERNSFRMQPFHRLDLSATLEGKPIWKAKSSWTFSVYNVYGRRNPFLYYIDNEGEAYNSDMKVQAKKVSIIPFPLPSVTWNFSF